MRHAIIGRNRNVVKYLLQCGECVELNLQDYSKSLLDYLFEGDSLLQKLAEFRIDKDACDENGKSLLESAFDMREYEACMQLFVAGSDPLNLPHKNAQTIFIQAIQEKNDRAFDVLLEAIDVNETDSVGMTPVHHASAYNNGYALKALLQISCEVNKQSISGWTPLHVAIGYDASAYNNLHAFDQYYNLLDVMPDRAADKIPDKATFDLLLNAKADINIPSDKGYYPLHVAICVNNISVVSGLVKAGAKVNVVDKKGRTPIMTALWSRKLSKVYDMLLGHNADVNLSDNNGRTLLHDAVVIRDVAVVKRLVQKGADINALTSSGQSPL